MENTYIIAHFLMFVILLVHSIFQLKVMAIDDHLNTIYEDAVKFDSDLPEFR